MSRKRQRADEADAVTGGEAESTKETPTLGCFLWSEISMLMYYRMLRVIQDDLTRLAKAGSPEERRALVNETRLDLYVTWASGKRHISKMETPTSYDTILVLAQRFIHRLDELVSSTEAAEPPSPTEMAQLLVHLLSDEGFSEEDCALHRLVVSKSTRAADDIGNYSYSERTTLALPMLPRYEGDKRSEEEHSHPRAGYEVRLPFPHPHPEVNTRIQLVEPRKRKPVLDEYRIFSHPKKTATHAVEDFLVDEELTHRAYVVVAHFLDTYGSLEKLSPFARMLLWNVLDRDDAIYDALFEKQSTLSTVTNIAEVRRIVAIHMEAYRVVRPSARSAAQQLGWYALSAQWRDQITSRLEEIDDGDWYFLADGVKTGFPSIFPNYSTNPLLRCIVLALLRKMDHAYVAAVDNAMPIADVVQNTLLPFLEGACPSAALEGSTALTRSPQAASHSARVQRRMVTAMETKSPVRWVPLEKMHDGASSSTRSGVRYAFISESMVFPLQCIGELFELSNAIGFSTRGADDFASTLLNAEWITEQDLMSRLLELEPLNAAVAPLVGIPRIYRDLVTAIQLLQRDTFFAHVVMARQVAEKASSTVWLSERSYAYWKCLFDLSQEEDYAGLILCLEVAVGNGVTGSSGSAPVLPATPTEARLERMPLVWPGEVEVLAEEEKQYRDSHDCPALCKAAFDSLPDPTIVKENIDTS